MGKVEDMVILTRAPSERLPLLGQAAPSSPTYLSQEEVVQQASAAPWPGLRRALVCLLVALYASLLSMAVLLLLTMPRPPPPLAWWQKASFYHLPPASFPDSNGDANGDLTGESRKMGRGRLRRRRPSLGSLSQPYRAGLLGERLHFHSWESFKRLCIPQCVLFPFLLLIKQLLDTCF